jgi:hypothetical protein
MASSFEKSVKVSRRELHRGCRRGMKTCSLGRRIGGHQAQACSTKGQICRAYSYRDARGRGGDRGGVQSDQQQAEGQFMDGRLSRAQVAR